MGSSQLPAGSKKPDLFGPDGRQALSEHADNLFPSTVRPAFLRFLWLGLSVAGVGIAAAVLAISGRLG